MNNGYPAGEVRPMIDRGPPNAAETRGASVRTRFGEPRGLVRAFSALPIALERHIVGVQELAYGKCRSEWLSGAAYDVSPVRCTAPNPLRRLMWLRLITVRPCYKVGLR